VSYNVIRDYDWTSIPKGSALRNNAPKVTLRSYKITSSDSLNRLNNYINIATAKDADSFYQGLYKNAKPEDTFVLPYFTDTIRSFTNNFGDTFQAGFLGMIDSALEGAFKVGGSFASMNPISNLKVLGDKAGTLASNFAAGKGSLSDVGGLTQGMTSAPGSYIETPKLYQYEQNDTPLEISFILANTVSEGGVDKNHDLIKHLTSINRPKRLNAIEMEPPRIYKVKVDGFRYMEWAYCSSFNVSFLGTRRLIGNKIVPEGFLVSMTLTSLTTEVSNFMDKV
jgi:hypothetical protein